MSRLSLSRPGTSVDILKVADLKFQNFHSKELERCLAFDALALLGGNEYLVQVEYFCEKSAIRRAKNIWESAKWQWISGSGWSTLFLYNSAIRWARNIWENAKWQWESVLGVSTSFCTTQQFWLQTLCALLKRKKEEALVNSLFYLELFVLDGNVYLIEVQPHFQEVADMKFVKSDTSGTCVKCFGLG